MWWKKISSQMLRHSNKRDLLVLLTRALGEFHEYERTNGFCLWYVNRMKIYVDCTNAESYLPTSGLMTIIADFSLYTCAHVKLLDRRRMLRLVVCMNQRLVVSRLKIMQFDRKWCPTSDWSLAQLGAPIAPGFLHVAAVHLSVTGYLKVSSLHVYMSRYRELYLGITIQ